jgi:predicted O-methyltransferase YrrM
MKKFESIYVEGLETFINEKLTPRPFSIMKEMEDFAEKNKIPILSPATGAILKFLITVYKPKKILELGTGLGYSTAWMISSRISLEIDTIDRNARELKSAESFLTKLVSPMQKITFLHAHCLEFLKQTEKIPEYDFIFVDCDKICYPEILEILKTKSKPKTILAFDNVLWHARLDETKYTKPSDKAIQEFWKQVKATVSNSTLFPAGDGLLVIENGEGL